MNDLTTMSSEMLHFKKHYKECCSSKNRAWFTHCKEKIAGIACFQLASPSWSGSSI